MSTPPVTPKSTPKPPVMPPPSPYRNQRQGELEALKQRGLAKLLNKHFTSVTKSIAEEKAAADAALRDLEQRKANTSEVHPPTYGELSPYDKLYMELRQKKAECKRKEKETLLLYQRYVNKFGGTGVVKVPFVSPDSSRRAAPAESPKRPPPSKELVPQLATEIDKTVEQHLDSGADRHPSAHTMGMDETYQTVHTSQEDQDRALTRKMEQDRGVDARYTPRGTKYPRADWQPLVSVNGKPPLDPNVMPAPPLLAETPVSGVTQTDGEALEGSNITLPTVDPTVDTSTEQDDKANEDSDDSNEKSVVSGLTSVDAMSDAESRLIEYLKSETEAIRQMLDEDEDSCSKRSKNTSYSAEVASQTDLAAKQAEQMLAEMRKILADSHAEAESVASAQSKHEPRKLETDNPDEKWMVYFDENHQREYYHEVNSNTVQWEKPFGGASTTSSSRSSRSSVSPEALVPMSDFTKKRSSVRSSSAAQQLSFEDVMPEIHAAGLGRVSSTRRLKYRQKQRRRRKRRRRIAVVTAVALVCGGIYFKADLDRLVNNTMSDLYPHLPKSLQWEENTTFLAAVSNAANNILPESLRWDTATQEEVIAVERAAHEELELERQQEEEEEARQATDAALQTLEELETHALVVVENVRGRPWGCNIPFAYLFHRKCWRVAKENPVFDLKELVQAMMQ